MAEKAKVFIDARMVTPVRHGFGRYVSMMARGLAAVQESQELKYDPVFLINPSSEVSELKVFPVCEIKSSFLNPSEMVEIPRVLKATSATLYHSPTFSSLWYSPCPWLVTIHDLNHLTFGGVGHRAYYQVLLKRFAKKAKKVFTVSQFSRDEISYWSGLQKDSIEVMPAPLDPRFRTELHPNLISETLSSLGLERDRYFFTLSNLKPHKNLGLLVNSYQQYRQAEQAAGRSPWQLVLNTTWSSKIEGLLALGSLAEDQSQALMAGAGAFVFPSLYEGFGIPPLEAAAVGAPVIASEIPPLKEGLFDLKSSEIIWADPKDAAAWAKAMATASQGGLTRVSVGTRSQIFERYDLVKFGRKLDQVYLHMLGLRA